MRTGSDNLFVLFPVIRLYFSFPGAPCICGRTTGRTTMDSTIAPARCQLWPPTGASFHTSPPLALSRWLPMSLFMWASFTGKFHVPLTAGHQIAVAVRCSEQAAMGDALRTGDQKIQRATRAPGCELRQQFAPRRPQRKSDIKFKNMFHRSGF